MSGKLSLVATPIGNLEDITLRAIRVLAEADVVFAEDTRRTAHLLAHHRIRRPLVSCHNFNEARRSQEIARRAIMGEKIALVSDAGSPGISDPGFRMVRSCLEAGVMVEVVPGACAAIAALSGSGLPIDEFHFVGFLPQKSGACEKRLRALMMLPGTLVLYESPYRVVRTLKLLATLGPERPLVVAREMTKRFEEYRRGRASELIEHFEKIPPKGEFVVLVGAEGTEIAKV